MAAARGARKLAGTEFYRAIWKMVARVPRGRVATYGQIASLVGRPDAPRVPGYALRLLPEGSRVPWHRIVNAEGRISPRASSFLGESESLQRALLHAEGVRFDPDDRVDLSRYQWRPRVTPRAERGLRRRP